MSVAVAGGIGAGVGSWASQHLGGVAVQGLNIAGPAVKGMAGCIIGGGFGGFAGGTASGLLSGESFGDALALGAKGALFGAAVGGMVGTAQGIKYAKANHLDAWSGAAKGKYQGNFALKSSWKNWDKYMSKRGWAYDDIQQTLLKGEWTPHSGTNYLNPGNSMSIVTNPNTGQSLIIDNVTKEIIQLGGKGFKY